MSAPAAWVAFQEPRRAVASLASTNFIDFAAGAKMVSALAEAQERANAFERQRCLLCLLMSCLCLATRAADVMASQPRLSFGSHFVLHFVLDFVFDFVLDHCNAMDCGFQGSRETFCSRHTPASRGTVKLVTYGHLIKRYGSLGESVQTDGLLLDQKPWPMSVPTCHETRLVTIREGSPSRECYTKRSKQKMRR